MKKGALLLLSALLLATCTDKSSGPGNPEPSASVRQINGCFQMPSLAGFVYTDSCFTYQFGDTLAIEFCLTGNCCPDSDRFSLVYEMKSDTIIMAATDTAQHLCRCICNYRIRAVFANLPLNSYVFVCTRSDDSGKVYYAETVSRGMEVH